MITATFNSQKFKPQSCVDQVKADFFALKHYNNPYTAYNWIHYICMTFVNEQTINS